MQCAAVLTKIDKPGMLPIPCAVEIWGNTWPVIWGHNCHFPDDAVMEDGRRPLGWFNKEPKFIMLNLDFMLSVPENVRQEDIDLVYHNAFWHEYIHIFLNTGTDEEGEFVTRKLSEELSETLICNRIVTEASYNDTLHARYELPIDVSPFEWAAQFREENGVWELENELL